MRGAWLVACVLVVPACLRDPVPLSGDGGDADDAGDGADGNTDGWTTGTDPGPELSVTELVGGAFMVAQTMDPAATGFEIEFPQTGFPNRIGWDGGDQLVSAAAPACGVESGIGLALYPNRKITDPSAGTGAEVSQPIVSPLVVQVAVPIDVAFDEFVPGTCPGRITGSSVFTIFPDGRIHRHDRVSNSAILSIMECQPCTVTPSDFFFTSYVVANIDDANAIVLDPPADASPTPTTRMCAIHEGRSLAVGWRTPGAATQRYRIFGGTVASVHDIRTGATIGDGTHERDSDLLLDATATACLSLNNRLAAITPDTQELEIAELRTVMRQGDDGIFDNGSAAGPPAPIAASTITLRSATGIAGGFAVRLSFGGQSTAELRMRRSSGTSATAGWGRISRLADGTVVFFFRDPLLPTESITIQL